MLLIDHPNVLRAHCSFTVGHNLWVVMPYMSGGSCLHIMKSDYPEGFEEPVIATLLHEVLKALVYVHAHGHIHRDVKVYLTLFPGLLPFRTSSECCMVFIFSTCNILLVTSI